MTRSRNGGVQRRARKRRRRIFVRMTIWGWTTAPYRVKGRVLGWNDEPGGWRRQEPAVHSVSIVGFPLRRGTLPDG